MGRLPKKVVDRIRALHQAGYLQTEIAEQLKISRGSVAKYIKQWQKESEETSTPPPSVLEVLSHSFLNLLATLQVALFLNGDDVGELYDDLAYEFLDVLSRRDKALAVKLLQKNQYIMQLRSAGILDLKKPEGDLSESERKKRQSWLRLLKKNPEVLKQLV